MSQDPHHEGRSEIKDPAAEVKAAYRYWAFISYSHRDSAWAKRVHSKLETWPVPSKFVGRDSSFGKLPARLFPIFLDRDEIAGGESLDVVIRAALSVSRYLIVICSPNAVGSKYVNEEIRTFKEMGRAGRIIYLIVGGDPSGGDSTDPKSGGCFPLQARLQMRPDGSPGEEEIEPLAADARPGRDGPRDALVKVMARLLEVGFDELNLRQARRERRALALKTAGLAILGGLLLAAYFAAADAGLHMPFCDAIRQQIDRHEISYFRSVPPERAIQTVAHALSSHLSAALVERRRADAWFNDPPTPAATAGVSLMSHSQSLSALAAHPEKWTTTHFADFRDSIETVFRNGQPIEREGMKWGWSEHGALLNRAPTAPSVTPSEASASESEASSPTSFIPLWLEIALCETFRMPAFKAEPTYDAQLKERLNYTQEALELYRDQSDSGGWNIYPFQKESNQHSVYASTLALLGLAEAHRSGLPWLGSVERRDALIRQTSRWLLSQYRAEGARHGWLNDPTEEHVNEVFDGLTAETYCALLEAAQTGAADPLPPALFKDIQIYTSGCLDREIDYAVDVSYFRIPHRQVDGTETIGIDSVRFLWWPWVIRCGELWLHSEAARQARAEDRVQVRRALAHLVMDLGSRELSKATQGYYSYVLSENLYCLRRAYPEE